MSRRSRRRARRANPQHARERREFVRWVILIATGILTAVLAHCAGVKNIPPPPAP